MHDFLPMCNDDSVYYITSTPIQEAVMFTNTTRIPRSPAFVERRKAERSANDGDFQPRSRGEREFGIGYGRSSGYVRNRSYVASQPALFRCR